jgi:Flp pilus assembly protein TadD
MSLLRNLPFAFALLLAACGTGHTPDNARLTDAATAEAALDAGTPDIALRLSDATLAQHPTDGDALTRRGLALTELGRLDEARASLSMAVTSQPRNVRALLALGRVQLPVDPAQAEINFESALKQDSRNAAVLNNLGIARDLQGHHADAEASYRAAMAAQPEMVAAQVNLALCLAISGRGNDAIRLMRPLADAPEATQKIKEDYAAVLAMAGEREEAQRILSSNMAETEVTQALDALTLARATPAAAMRVSDRVTPAPAIPVSAQVLASAPAGAASDHPATVQLASLNSEEAAHDTWQQLSKRFPNLLNGKHPVFSHAERDGHTFWRVRTSGFQDVAQAQTFCDHLRTAGGGTCSVYDF